MTNPFHSAGWITILALTLLPWTTRAGETNDVASNDRGVTLYLGLEVTLEHRGDPCPVLGIERDAVRVLTPEGRIVRVKGRMDRMVTTSVPRARHAAVVVEDMKTALSDSSHHLRQIEAMRQQVTMDDIQQSNTERAEAELHLAESFVQMNRNASDRSPPGMGGGPSAADHARVDAATRAVDAAAGSSIGGQYENQAAVGVGAHDTFEVSFTIAAPMDLRAPRGILRLFFRVPGGGPEAIAAARFFDLPQLRSKPTRVTVIIDHLPRGFEVVDYSLDIYDGAREVLTTVARNRVQVSPDEAHRILIEYHAQMHRAATMPMIVIRDLLPAELRDLVSQRQRDLPVDVAVDANGRVTRLTLAPTGNPGALNLELAAALREVRFLPALVQGQPVASEGRFALTELLPD